MKEETFWRPSISLKDDPRRLTFPWRLREGWLWIDLNYISYLSLTTYPTYCWVHIGWFGLLTARKVIWSWNFIFGESFSSQRLLIVDYIYPTYNWLMNRSQLCRSPTYRWLRNSLQLHLLLIVGKSRVKKFGAHVRGGKLSKGDRELLMLTPNCLSS